MFCPICGSRSFEDYSGRLQVRCASCGSLERHRLFALLALDHLPDLCGGKICLLAPGKALAAMTRIAPGLFETVTPADLIAAQQVDALFLRHEFEYLGMPVDEFFAEMRRKMPVTGLIAFTYSTADEGPAYEYRMVESSGDGRRWQHHFGPESLGWFNDLPGWGIEVWQPKKNFGSTAESSMRLHYKSGKILSNRILIARPVE